MGAFPGTVLVALGGSRAVSTSGYAGGVVPHLNNSVGPFSDSHELLITRDGRAMCNLQLDARSRKYMRESQICRAHPVLLCNLLPGREKSRRRSRRGAPAISHPSQASDPWWS
eukprot:9493370-Pyramimonas_sp.AAC.1